MTGASRPVRSDKRSVQTNGLVFGYAVGTGCQVTTRRATAKLVGELAAYCLHALAAGTLPSEAAVERLVAVTLAGLRPPR